MEKLVIVGCGQLANIVVDALLMGLLPEYELVGVYSRSTEKANRIVEKLALNDQTCRACSSLDELLALRPSYLVESASPAAMKAIAIQTLQNKTSIITLSIGALADETFYEQVIQTARTNNVRVYPVSGATGGFDVLRTAFLMGNASASFYNEKGPHALRGTPVYDPSLHEESRIVFSGNAKEAIALFPTRVNVAVAASLASVGPELMKMTMRSTPGFMGDTQRVEIRNDQVRAVIDVYSRTAAIAGWSAVNTLINITSPIVF